MAVGAGIASQVGFKSETTWNTPVTVDKFVELMDEDIKNDGGKRFVSKGIRKDRLVGHRAARGVVHIAGPLKLELPNVTMATLLRHMFGTIATTGSSPYTHTASPGNLKGQSMTVQVGRPDVNGTVNPFTWGGVKVESWDIAAQVDQYAELTLNVTGASEATGTALASASYAAGYSPFTFVQSSLTVAGGQLAINAFTLAGTNALKADRQGPGSAVIREQITNDKRVFSGTIDAEFEALANYTRFTAGTQAAVVITLSNGTDSLTITMNVEFTGESPHVAGPGILPHSQPFEVISATSDAAAITAVLINSDATST